MIHWRDLSGRALRVLRGVTLPCGCVGGLYETYAGTTVMIIDEADAACLSAQHQNGYMVSLADDASPAPDASTR
jgi:hypothetical protein